MEKALDLLEQHCQWLAVALGGLFLGWMLWAYVLMVPVAVPNGASAYTPGDVDDTIGKTFADPLNQAITQENGVTPPPQAQASVIKIWTEQLNGPTTPLPSLFAAAFTSPPSDADIGTEQKGPDKGAVLVTALPEIPPAQIAEAMAKRAYVGPALPPANAAAQPPAPAAPAPGALPPGHDLSYVRVKYEIDTAKIADAFAKVNVPAGINTGVVAVKLMRQERQPNDTWGEATEVPYLKNNVTLTALPPAGAGMPAINTFRTWSDSPEGQTALLRPVFYPVIFGEGPWDPSMDDSLPVYDPEAIRKEAARVAKEKADAKKAAAPPPSAAPTRRAPRSSGRRGGGGEGGNNAAVDPQRPAGFAGAVGVQYPGGRPPATPPGMPPGMNPGDDPTAGGPPGPPPQPGTVAPGAGQPPADPLPPAQFVPAAEKAFPAWAYDETVVEGHTYRYQVLYALRSPVYDSNIVNPPALAKVFAIWTAPDDKAWSAPVEVKPTAEFYLAATNWPGNRIPTGIKIDVYKWAQGKWQMSPFTVGPGDLVGDKIGEGEKAVDYGTDVTVVDLRYDPRGNGGTGRAYVLLLTADGRLVEREPTADRTNVRMHQLQQVIQANAPAPGQPAAPVPPAPGQPPIASGGPA